MATSVLVDDGDNEEDGGDGEVASENEKGNDNNCSCDDEHVTPWAHLHRASL